MSVHLGECELLAQLVAMAVVGVDIDRSLEQERLIQTVQLLASGFLPALSERSRCLRCSKWQVVVFAERRLSKISENTVDTIQRHG